jgi:hypothetical protein
MSYRTILSRRSFSPKCGMHFCPWRRSCRSASRSCRSVARRGVYRGTYANRGIYRGAAVGLGAVAVGTAAARAYNYNSGYGYAPYYGDSSYVWW